jgi:hypothetical protein
MTLTATEKIRGYKPLLEDALLCVQRSRIAIRSYTFASTGR